MSNANQKPKSLEEKNESDRYSPEYADKLVRGKFEPTLDNILFAFCPTKSDEVLMKMLIKKWYAQQIDTLIERAKGKANRVAVKINDAIPGWEHEPMISIKDLEQLAEEAKGVSNDTSE